MAFVQHKFGRYIILEPLAVGGMAEIFLAKLTDEFVGGPVRILVIKKVISSYSGNEDFVRMFEDEIKITAGFSHQCIVQIYDYGRVEEISFLAMEYVEGKTLRQFLVRLSERKQSFLVDMSCYVISQIASALAYAHSFQDRLEGKHLGIIHRDISPQNIMISYNGAVKLFDFGIAKAKSTAQETRAGIIKGKPSYLSPEQIAGETLDGRNDIFALGVVFWESLTGRRLFYGENDIQILRMIQKGKIEAPSVYNPEVPPELDTIVLRALHRDKNKRYQGAEELQNELHAFIYSYNPKFNPSDLGAYILKLFQKESLESRENLKKALEACRSSGVGQHGGSKGFQDLDSLFGSHKRNTPFSTAIPTRKGTQGSKTFTSSRQKRGFTKRPKQAKEMGEREKNKESVIPPWSIQKGGDSGEVDISIRSKSNTFEIARATQITRKKRKMGKLGRETNAFLLIVLAIIPALLFLYFGSSNKEDSGVEETTNRLFDEDLASPESEVSVEEEKTVPDHYTPAQLHLQTSVQGYLVYLNGHQVQVKQGSVDLPKGRPVSVLIKRSDYQDIEFSIQDNSSKSIAYPIAFKKLPYGYLTFTTDPGADITLKGRGREPAAAYSPIRNMRLPVGTYTIIIENELIGYKGEVEVTIKQGETVRIHKDLK